MTVEARLAASLFREEFARRHLEFEDHADAIERRLALLAPSGLTERVTVVMDTSALMDLAAPIDEEWCRLLNGQVRVVVPLRTVDELERHKFQSRDRARELAKVALRKLVDLLSETGTALRLAITANISIEVLIDPDRARPERWDEEILQTCADLRQFGCKVVRLFTGDVPMRFQAQARGIDAQALPEKLTEG